VEGSCEYGNEPSGSINAGKFLSSCTVGSFSRRAQLHELVSHYTLSLGMSLIVLEEHLVLSYLMHSIKMYNKMHCVEEVTFILRLKYLMPEK
jgi:uncharacterized membrane protein AbrB (regulator of aidB expression)